MPLVVAYGHEFIESVSQIGNNNYDENRRDSQTVVQYLVVSYARYNVNCIDFCFLATTLLTNSISVGRIIILEHSSTIMKYQC